MSWTDKDEDELQRLTAAKAACLADRRAAVERIVAKVYFRQMNESEVVDMLLDNAEELVQALRHYCAVSQRGDSAKREFKAEAE